MLSAVRELVAEKVAPRAAAIDESGEFPWDIKELFAQNDLFGIPIPAEYGGLGGTFLTYVKVVEEIAKACASSSLIVAVQELGMLPIMIARHRRAEAALPSKDRLRRTSRRLRADRSLERIRRARLDAHARRKATATATCSTAEDLDHQRQRRRRRLRLRGDRSRQRARAASARSSSRRACRDSRSGKLEKKMGIRGSPTVELMFDDCEVPAANRLGEEGEGFKIAMKVLDKSRPGIAAQALGIAAGALEYATNYAKERIAFGKPIGQHQGVGFMLADMKTEVEAARLLLYEAARKCDAGSARRHAVGRAWRSSNAATWRCRSPPTPCRFSADSATRPTIRSSA